MAGNECGQNNRGLQRLLLSRRDDRATEAIDTITGDGAHCEVSSDVNIFLISTMKCDAITPA